MATRDHVVTIKNNDRQPVAGPVSFIRLHASTGNLKVDIEGRITELAVGQAIELDKPIDLFHVENTTGADVNATFKLGFGARITDSNLSGTVGISKATRCPVYADVSCAAGTKTLVLPANSSRRTALVTNFATNAAPIRVGDVNVGVAGTPQGPQVGQGMTASLDCTGDVWVFNEGGVAQSVAVGEILD